MLDPDRTASRTKKKKKNASAPLIEAPVQSQDAKTPRKSLLGCLGALAIPSSKAPLTPRTRAGSGSTWGG
jgi:hypothetical protein